MIDQAEYEKQAETRRKLAAAFDKASQRALDLALSISHDVETRKEDFARRGGSVADVQWIVEKLEAIKDRMTGHDAGGV